MVSSTGTRQGEGTRAAFTGGGILDLNEVEPDWKLVLAGACACKPVPAMGGALFLTDGRKVLFLSDKGKIKWQARLKLSRTGKDGSRGLVPLSSGFVVAYQGWNVFGLNQDGLVVWKTQAPHAVQSVEAASEVTGGLLARGDGEASLLGIRGRVLSTRKEKDAGVVSELPKAYRGEGASHAQGRLASSAQGQMAGEPGRTAEPSSTDAKSGVISAGGRKIILPAVSGRDGSYTVLTKSGVLMVAESSWLVSAWKVCSELDSTMAVNAEKTGETKGAATGETTGEIKRTKAAAITLNANDRQVLARLAEYTSLLATASRDTHRPNHYHTALLDTCAMIHEAALLELPEVSPLFARAVALETNGTLLTALMQAAAEQSYDEGDLLEAIGKKTERMTDKDESALCAASDAVKSICSFMGGQERKAKAVEILTNLSDAKYPQKVRAAARQTLAIMARE